MTGQELQILPLALSLAAAMLSLAALLAVVRLACGPTVPDRVMGLDFLTVLAIGIIAVYSIATDESQFLDVAISVALITFFGTVAFANYLERRTHSERRDHQ